ncbi:Undecaprenyl-phosphate 4-deoxy-4-formamido-L-arabinose transferase [Streptomyces californicus]
MDDGSRDRTRSLLSAIAARDPRAHYTAFSRNFGKEAAMLAGLRMSRGAAVVIMDADLQHPPELIPRMLELHRPRHTTRSSRAATARARACSASTLSHTYYALVRRCMDVELIDGSGDFPAAVRRRRRGQRAAARPECDRTAKGIFRCAAPQRAFVRLWCAAGIAGTAAGALVLITSPGSRNRRERFGAETTSLLSSDSLAASLRAFAEITVTVVTTWQYVGAVAAGVLLGLLCRRADGATPRPPAHWPLLVTAGVLVLLVSGYLCTVIAYPVFGARVSAPSANRLWNDYLLLYVILLVGAGALLGLALRRLAPRTATPAKAVCAALCVLACLGPAVALTDLGTELRDRAEKWDAQDHRLREGAADGKRVLPYERLVISQMLEPFSEGGRRYWPGGCVADFYHLDRVTDGSRGR